MSIMASVISRYPRYEPMTCHDDVRQQITRGCSLV